MSTRPFVHIIVTYGDGVKIYKEGRWKKEKEEEGRLHLQFKLKE